MSTKQSDGPSKAERLTSLIYALATTERKFNAERIGDYLNPDGNPEAREKAIERLKDDIRNEFGLRLISESVDGTAYYRIDTSDWFLPAIDFTVAETGMIALAASLWKDSKLQALALSAAARITGNQSTELSIAPYAGAMLPRLSMDDPNFKTCALAVFNKKTLKFDYQDAQENTTKRVVDMWGIGQRFGNWYFTGWDHSRGAERVFRLNRVQGNFATQVRRDGASSNSYRARPQDFSMTQVLQDFDLRNPGHLAVVEVLDEQATPLRARAINGTRSSSKLNIGYADRHSFAAELASYGASIRVLEPAALVSQVADILRQARDAQAEIPLRESVKNAKFKPHRAMGRSSTAQQVMRNIDMIQFVVSQGSATIGELSERYSLTQSKVRDELAMIMMCGVPNGQHDELINVNDGDLDSDVVTISNAALLAEPQKLAPLEAVAVLGGLNALVSIPEFEHREVLLTALEKINAAVARFEGWNGALGFALNQVREHDTPAQLIKALRNSEVVEIDYYSANSQTHQLRVIEPLRIIEDGPVQYLRAWCRTRQAILTFRIDRVLEATLTGEHFELTERHQDVEKLDFSYSANSDDLEVEFFVHQDVLPVIEAFNPIAWSQSKVDSGHLAKVQLSHHLVAAPWVARNGGKIVVVAPDATRERVTKWLDDAIRMYED
ncbi:helix-turn-helix transcriptional regulator [Glutamicibacter arilaitensis]|uniref:helix-turn-helix transcriptional regulator n=1 Tax=Glutamicibacter arilaitensis TaxID=256701 RepID=UPI00384B2FBB